QHPGRNHRGWCQEQSRLGGWRRGACGPQQQRCGQPRPCRPQGQRTALHKSNTTTSEPPQQTQRNHLAQHKIPHKRAPYHVLNEASEEWLAGEVLVVGLEELSGGLVQLESGELEALLLEAADDFA